MQKRGVRALVTLPAVVALAAVAVAAPPVAAGGGTTIDVTTTQDIDGSESTCSLREAVEAANTDTAFGGCPAGNGADTIRLPAGRYVFAPVPGTDEDANVDGDIDILEGVTIRGVGSTRTTIDGNGEETGERVFNMPTGVRATFRDLTIRNGRDQTGDGGGAIFSDDGTGNLVLRTVRILANYGEGYGGGVAMDGTGDLRIYNSVIEDNDSDGYGGGVYTSENDVWIENSRVNGNSGDDGGGGIYLEDTHDVTLREVKIIGNSTTDSYYGGGIYVDAEDARILRSTITGNAVTYDESGYGGGVYQYGGSLQIRASTIDSNSVSADGGGIYQEGGDLAIRSTTISHNRAQQYGGAIYQTGGAELWVVNSTISRNVAHDTAGGIYANGLAVDLHQVTIYRNQVYSNSTGIGFHRAQADVDFSNSIIAKNRYEGSSDYYDCFGGSSLGGNVVSDGVDCGTNDDDIVGESDSRIDPKLGPLEDNGGPTLTHRLMAGSPAIGAGLTENCAARDQRGVLRTGSCDSGAYERP